MRTVHLGRAKFEIPSHMTLAGMIECWRDEARYFEALAKDIVENHPQFAWEITSLWLDKHHHLLMDDPAYKAQ